MEEKQKVNYSTFVQAASAVVTAVALILLMFGWLTPDEQGTNRPEARGVTNFDSLTLDNDLVVGGDVSITGDSAFTGDFGNLVTIGDATAADAVLLYDGNAQDYYLALDDSADDLLIGLGSTVGTTGIVFLDENQDVGLGGASAGSKLDITGNQMVDGAADEIQVLVQGFTTQTTSLLVAEQSDGTDVATLSNAGLLDISGELNYGANDLSILGYASAGEQAVSGTDTMTTTLSVSHGLTTVTFCLATLGEDPETGAGDAAAVTAAVSANACTVKTWQDDFTAATETDVVVHWLVIGTP